MTRGAIVVDEVVIPIVDIRLRQGRIHIFGQLNGPIPARDVDAYSIHDETGEVVCRIHAQAQGMRWEAVEAGSTINIEVPLQVADKTAVPGTMR